MKEQEERLRQALLDEARMEADSLIAKAHEEAKALTVQGERENAALRKERLEALEAEYSQKKIQALRNAEVMGEREWLLAQENAIEGVLTKALATAEGLSGDARVRALARLLTEAFRAVGRGACQVLVNSQDGKWLTDDWALARYQEVFGNDAKDAVSVVAGGCVMGGVIVRTEDGMREFDNTFAMRMERMKDDLRVYVAGEQN